MNQSDLDQKFYPGICEIINEGGVLQSKGSKVEFDIDQLPTRVARNLEKFVRANLPPIHQKTSKKPAVNKQFGGFQKESLAPKPYNPKQPTSSLASGAGGSSNGQSLPVTAPSTGNAAAHLPVFASPDHHASPPHAPSSKSSSFFTDSEDDK